MEATQLAKETTAIDLACLLDAGKGAVVTLVAGDTRLVAHRAVLVDRSPVFSAMFGHDSLEASSGEVTIADVEGPVLRQLLAFLYTLQAPQLPDIAPQLLVAADKYGVPVLKAACEQQLAEHLSVETAAAAVLLAIRHSCPSLRQAAIAYIKDHLVEVMATQGWADAVNDRPKDVEELSQLLSESPAETSSPTPTDSGHSDDSQAPASGAPATAASRHTPTPDDATVARLRRLPKVDKGLRLFQAAVEGAVGDLEVLLAAGADIEARSGGRTSLHVTANLGHVEVARRLVAHGAQVDARDANQWTPLHWAAHSGHAAVARLLLAASADHHARESLNGWTPLHWAACNGRTEVAAALLEAGAATGAWSTRGESPLDLAEQNNHREVKALLSRTQQPRLNTIIICSN